MEFQLTLIIIILVWLGLKYGKPMRKLLKRIDALEAAVRELRQAHVAPLTLAVQPKQTSEVPSPKTVPEHSIPSVSDLPPPHSSSTLSTKPSIDLEQIISTRLGVWVGAIALILGAVFLVKYSIEEGWLLPSVRVVMSALFGIALVSGAEFVRRHEAIPNAFRIAQGLSGAGFAALYGAVYSATSLYDLIPNVVGFIGLSGITAAAIIAALRYGLPIAVLGMVGGFVTPMLVRSNTPDALSLFGYLFILTTMGMVVAQRKGWWLVGWLSVIGALLWTTFWILVIGSSASWILIFFGLPLILLTATMTSFTGDPAVNMQPTGISSLIGSSIGINAFTIGIFTLLMFVLPISSFDNVAWLMAFLMSLAVVVLAKLRPNVFGQLLVPLQIAIMLIICRNIGTPWTAAEAIDILPQTLLLLGGFTVLFTGAGIVGLIGHTIRSVYAWLTASSIFISYSIGYIKLKGLPSYQEVTQHFVHSAGIDLLDKAPPEVFWQQNMVWGMGALALSSLLVYFANRESGNSNQDEKNNILAGLSVGSSALLCLSLVQVFPLQTWSIALALQVLLTMWIYANTHVKALPKIIKALVVILMVENCFGIFIAIFNLLLFRDLANTAPMTVVYDYIIPAVILFISTRLIAPEKDSLAYKSIFYMASILGLIGGSYCLGVFSQPDQIFMQKNLQTLLILCAAAIGLKRAEQKGYASLTRTLAIKLLILGCWRLLVFHLLFNNPLFTNSEVGAVPFFNATLFGYLLPVVPLHITAKHLGLYDKYNIAVKSVMTFLFVLGSGMVIRQLFNGNIIQVIVVKAHMGEQICYSALGLLTGLGILALAIRLKDTAWRWLSLVVIMVTVGKVFLIDASYLSGLMRVLSFIGLGLSLFGLSAFYSRYVFRKDN